MPTYLLEVSFDDLSDTTPTYTDLTSRFLEGSYQRDGGGDLDDPQAGTANFTFDNRDRFLEPGFAGGYNVRPLNRIRFSIDGDMEFTGFITSWGVEWPDSAINQETTVTAVDGSALLELENLESLDPPDADSYADVVSFDDPSFYYRVGEPAGTKLVAHKRVVRYTKNHKKRKRVVRWKTRETREELGGVSGPSGTYKGTPSLGQPGLILGDSDTAAYFDDQGPDNEYARVLLDASDLIDANALTIEAWVHPVSSAGAIVGGPFNTGGNTSVFQLFRGGAGLTLTGFLLFIGGSTLTVVGGTVPTDATSYVAMTWNGTTLILYVNGVETGRVTGSGKLDSGDANEFLYIGRASFSGITDFFDGRTDEVAVYEKALSPARILAHYQAGAQRGFAEQTAGARILTIATHDLWAETDIQAGVFNVQPQMKHGQSKLEELMEAFACEGPHNHWFFQGNGDPKYLGWNFADTTPYNAVAATVGDGAGEVPYEDVSLVYDDLIYNEVTISRDGGEAQTVSDAASQSAYRIRRYSETGLILSRDEDAATIAATILDEFKQPQLRASSITLSGADSGALTQIRTREPGDLIRVKRRPKGGTAIDRVARIKSKSVTIPRGHYANPPSCTFQLTRGFNAALSEWHLGISGFSELGSTAVLA